MTEADWLACESPENMISSLEKMHPYSARELTLLCVAAARRVQADLLNPISMLAVQAAEQYANGEITHCELQRHWASAEWTSREPLPKDPYERAGRHANWAAVAAATPTIQFRHAARCIRNVLKSTYHLRVARDFTGKTRDEVAGVLCGFIRCIFPLRPVTFLPEWRTSTVVALAEQMFKSRNFSAMPILADALEDADCHDEAILMHCRGTGPHTRGCFVIDGCIGKS